MDNAKEMPDKVKRHRCIQRSSPLFIRKSKAIREVQRDVKHSKKCARSMASLSVDILMEIFLRLSPRTLVRFRCVCKYWNSLLTGPSFIKAHLERSIKSHKFDLLKYDLDKFSRVQVRHSPMNELSDLDTSFVKDGKKFNLVGSFNGIVCLSTFSRKNPQRSQIFLWNPSTRENIALPQPSYHVSNLVGFGFNPLSGHPDDFIVVNVNIHFERRHNYTSQVCVYSFRRNCWKQLGNIFPPSLTRHLGDQVIFENFICWCPYFRLNRELVTLLVLFDVVKDVFQTIAFPDIMPPGEKYISLLDGCLSLMARNSTTGHYEVWIMKEFAVCESWTKLCTIGVSTRSGVSYRSLGFAYSGEIFFVSRRHRGLRLKSPTYLVLYNVQSEKFEAPKVEVDSYYRGTRLVTCIESLISLSFTNNVEQQPVGKSAVQSKEYV